MLILFASETGSSKEYAIRFAQEYYSIYPDESYSIMDMDTYYEKMALINEWPLCFKKENMIVYFISTCGDGECPTNMRKFWKAILSSNILLHQTHTCKSAVFSFGDSSYPKYNWAAKKFYRRIEQLGAQFITKNRIDCDDRSINMGQESGYLAGRNEIIPSLLNFLIPSISPTSFLITKTPKKIISSPKFNANLLEISSLSNLRDIRHLLLRLDKPPIHKPEPGDLIRIFPHNTDLVVEEYLSFLNWDGEDVITLDLQNSLATLLYLPFQCTTIFNLFKYCLDLNTPPRPLFFYKLSLLTEDSLYKERLLELYKDRDSYDSYCFRQWRRTPIECLKDFPMISRIGDGLSIADHVDFLMPMRFRDYSISDFIEEDKIQLTISLIKFNAPRAPSLRYGTASRWMDTLIVGTGMDVRIIPNCKRWIDLLTMQKDVIIFATGAGISPMLFIINHLYKEWGIALPFKIYLFIGCRSAHMDGGDLLHYARFKFLIENGFPLSLYILGSRDHIFIEEKHGFFETKKIITSNSPRLHIDTLINLKDSLLKDLLKSDPTIFIGGNPKIPKLISETSPFKEKFSTLRVILECW